MKKFLAPILILLAVAIVYFLFRPTSVTSSTSPDIVIYWGQGCPHCENVKKYIAEHELDQKLKISLKEVYLNQSNQTEMANVVKDNCPELVKNGGVGVPFAFIPSTKKCAIGDQPIIDVFSSLLK